MEPLLPKPYTDEILYSVIARWQLRSGIFEMAEISTRLFGQSSYTLSIAMPTRLHRLKNYLPLPVTLDEVVFRHTLYPYYSTFTMPGHKAMIQKDMLDPNARKFWTKIAEPSAGLSCCPVCLSEDMRKFGEPYWHRIHQLPGVLVCPMHNARLFHTCPVCKTPLTDAHTGFYQITPTFCPHGHHLTQVVWNTNEKLLTIALDSLFVLGGGLQELNLEALQRVYVHLLRRIAEESNQREWSARLRVYEYLPDNHVERYMKSKYYGEMRHAFVSYFGAEVLQEVSAGFAFHKGRRHYVRKQRSLHPEDWLHRLLFHKISRYTPPLHHLLTMSFFSGNAQNFLVANNGLIQDTLFAYLSGMLEVAVTADDANAADDDARE